jgi:hypothetical protein
MSYLSAQTSTRKIWPTIVAGVSLFIAAASSIAGLNLFGAWVGFGFIPLVVLVIWPRRANRLVSLAFVFFAGLFMDWATGGVDGQWALVFVLVWGYLRPELRSASFSPFGLLSAWFAACGSALIILSLSGYFVVRILPDFAVIGRQVLFATCLLPLFLLLRHGLAMRVGDSEDWS